MGLQDVMQVCDAIHVGSSAHTLLIGAHVFLSTLLKFTLPDCHAYTAGKIRATGTSILSRPSYILVLWYHYSNQFPGLISVHLMSSHNLSIYSLNH